MFACLCCNKFRCLDYVLRGIKSMLRKQIVRKRHSNCHLAATFFVLKKGHIGSSGKGTTVSFRIANYRNMDESLYIAIKKKATRMDGKASSINSTVIGQ